MSGSFEPQKVEPTGTTSSQDEELKEVADSIGDVMEPFTESTPATQGLLTQGSAKELMRQASIAQRLEDALSFLRTISKTRDYFVGYTISDVIVERLAKIGLKDDDDSADAMINSGIDRTDISKLNKLSVDLLGDPKNKANMGAIKEALALKEKLTKNAQEDDGEALVDMGGFE